MEAHWVFSPDSHQAGEQYAADVMLESPQVHRIETPRIGVELDILQHHTKQRKIQPHPEIIQPNRQNNSTQLGYTCL